VGWGAVKKDSLVGVEECFNVGGSVGGEVVDDAVKFKVGWYFVVERGEEANEVDT
jgi:hypothetical protein